MRTRKSRHESIPTLYLRVKENGKWTFKRAVMPPRPGTVKVRRSAEHPKGEQFFEQSRFYVREQVQGRQRFIPVGDDEDPQIVLGAARSRASHREWNRSIDKRHGSVADTVADYLKHLHDTEKFKAEEHAQHVLSEFRTVLDEQKPTIRHVKAIKKEHLQAFHKWLRDVKNPRDSERTIANKHDRVLSWLRYVGVDVAFAKGLKPKYQKLLPTVYSKSEVKKLFSAAANDYERVLLHLGFYGAMREQEIQHACWNDINWEDKTIRVQNKPEYNFKVKDSEDRDIPLPSETIALLKSWHKERSHTPLILGIGKEHTQTESHLLRHMKRIGARVGVRGLLHEMRRTRITQLIQASVDLRSVMAIAGHSDFETVLRYAKPVTAARLQSTIDVIR